MRAKQLFISGLVQGVGFRAWTVTQARALALRGWVRNRRDGRVEAVIAGDDQAVTQMLALCHQGPRAAKVTHVEVTDWGGELPTDFQQRATL